MEKRNQSYKRRGRTAKYIACDGEISDLGQIWTGITSPDMNFEDIRCRYIICQGKGTTQYARRMRSNTSKP